MPRHLARALEQLAALPTGESPDLEHTESPSLKLLGAYFRATAAFEPVGFEVPAPLRRQVAALWSVRPELRAILGALVLHYPCDEFLKAFYRAVERDEAGALDFTSWFRHYPELQGQLRPFVVERAHKFNQPFSAVRNGILWARYFDGSADAWRQIALTIKRRDRKREGRHQGGSDGEDFLRHDLEDHGILTNDEQSRLNQELIALGQEPIPIQPEGMWWHWQPDWPPARNPALAGTRLAAVAEASHRFAQEAWGAVDEEVYAQALARLPLAARAGFRQHAPFSEMHARVAELAERGA